MVYRRPGTLLPLERRILEVAIDEGADGIYGFALAQALDGGEGRALVAHGTLYKALDRLRRAGLLQAAWEDAEAATEEGRPRRRVYTVTAEGRHAATAFPAASLTRSGQAPA